MQILSLFGFSILAAATLATSLASVGLHLGTRNQWFHGWITAQSALLGVVIGLSISHDTTHAHTEMQWLPTLCSLAFAAIAYFLSTHYIRKTKPSNQGRSIAIYLLLISATYFVDSFFLQTDSHVQNLYIGDIVTLSKTEGYFGLLIAIVSLSGTFAFYRNLTKHSFELSVGIRHHSKSTYLANITFIVSSLICLSWCVQYMGYLFTLFYLIAPTSLLSLDSSLRLKGHLLALVVFSALGSMLGFLASLVISNVPTTPSMTLFTFALITIFVLIRLLIDLYTNKGKRLISTSIK
jgi:ABC-type Mn2+/Zn2+ transport system permease subunit